MKHRQPALPYARTLRVVAIVASIAMIGVAMAVPSTVGQMLVASAAAAGVVGLVAAMRSTGNDRTAWLLLAVGQLLNGIGNIAIAYHKDAWFAAPDWFSSIAFNLATLATV